MKAESGDLPESESESSASLSFSNEPDSELAYGQEAFSRQLSNSMLNEKLATELNASSSESR